MLLGIEIGGTKLQLGVSADDGASFVDFRKLDIQPAEGAAGIRQQIASAGSELVRQHPVQRVGIGFGGPVDAPRGRTITSHQITGWDDFPLAEWCEQSLGVPAVLGNDCDVATLAEAQYGAGRGRQVVFYVTVGTGVGGGCAIAGKLLGQGRPAIAEIGHLRPGLDALDPHDTVESIVSGWGIAAEVRRRLADNDPQQQTDRVDLLRRCLQNANDLTTVMIAEAARRGNSLARHAIDRSCRTLGWAIAQVVTLLAPEVIVVGGGVAQIGEAEFFQPLRQYARQYSFTPLRGSFEVVPAQLGERVVVHGAVALAAQIGHA